MWQAAVNWFLGFPDSPLEEVCEEQLQDKKVIRWGIIGSDRSALELAGYLAVIPSCRLVSIASPNLVQARELKDLFDLESVSVSGVHWTNVDVVYVSGQVSSRKADCITALQNGSHVVVEPPLALTEVVGEEIVRFAKQQQLLLVEAVLLKFSPAGQKLEELLSEGVVGKVHVIHSTCGTGQEDLPSTTTPGSSQGALLPRGAHSVAFALTALGGADEVAVAAAADLSPNFQMDLQVSMSLSFRGGQLASIICSNAVDLPGEAQIHGSLGFISVTAPFWKPCKFVVTKRSSGKPGDALDQVFEFPCQEESRPRSGEEGAASQDRRSDATDSVGERAGRGGDGEGEGDDGKRARSSHQELQRGARSDRELSREDSPAASRSPSTGERPEGERGGPEGVSVDGSGQGEAKFRYVKSLLSRVDKWPEWKGHATDSVESEASGTASRSVQRTASRRWLQERIETSTSSNAISSAWEDMTARSSSSGEPSGSVSSKFNGDIDAQTASWPTTDFSFASTASSPASIIGDNVVGDTLLGGGFGSPEPSSNLFAGQQKSSEGLLHSTGSGRSSLAGVQRLKPSEDDGDWSHLDREEAMESRKVSSNRMGGKCPSLQQSGSPTPHSSDGPGLDQSQGSSRLENGDVTGVKTSELRDEPLVYIGVKNMVEEVHRCIQEGQLESPLMPPSESLRILRILDRVRMHIGLKNPLNDVRMRIPSLSDWGNLEDPGN